MAQFLIPQPGFKLALTQAWPFWLTNAQCHFLLLKLMQDPRKPSHEPDRVLATMPKGSVLEVHRLQIPHAKHVEEGRRNFNKPAVGFNVCRFGMEDQPRPVHLWVDVEDVNSMHFEPLLKPSRSPFYELAAAAVGALKGPGRKAKA